MATHKAGFDPLSGPVENSRSRRLGQYTQQGVPKPEHKEGEKTTTARRMEYRRGQTAFPTLGTAPRPTLRDPSPGTSGTSEARYRGAAASGFGFGRPAPRPTGGEVPAPKLRGKSSRNVLRRKQSSIAQDVAASRPSTERTESSLNKKLPRTSTERRPSFDTQRSTDAYNEIFTRARPRAAALQTGKETPTIIPELDRYRTRAEHSTKFGVPHKLATHDLPPPTPLLSGTPGNSASNNHHRYSTYSGSGYSASPSTRFSESPGPGAYSRDTTPTSMSSQSPGIMAPLKGPSTPRIRQVSPAHTRPPITKRKAGSTPQDPQAPEGPLTDVLPILTESGLSSSSNSTVKAGDEGKTREGKGKKRPPPTPPSPPPRKSSQKFQRSPGKEQESPSKPSQAPAKPVMTSPSIASPPRSHPVASPSVKPKAPVRPSRDGAPDLRVQLGDTMKVIQSNLTGVNYAQERRKSSLPRGVPASPLQAMQTTFSPRPAQVSRLPSRHPSPSPIVPSTREATPVPKDLGVIPDLKPHQIQQIPPSSRGTASRTPSPSVTNARPRFGLFGRRSKTAPEVPTLETEKKARRGPAAGTGHEGYGRYGLRGRSGSSTSIPQARDRSSSRPGTVQDNKARTQDAFLLNRMSPVIIAGGGEIVENRNTSVDLARTESNTSILLGRAGVESRGSNRSKLSHEEQRTTLWPSALPKESARRAPATAALKGRRPSDSSDDSIKMGRSALAFRRSTQRFNSSTPALNLPKPLKLSNPGAASSMASLGASVSTNESRAEPKAEVGRERKGQLTKTRKLEKRPPSPRKWNFFHRSKPTKQETTQPALQVTVGKAPAKIVPYYAMLDSSDEQLEVDPMELENILREADAAVVDLTDEELDILQFGNYKENIRRIEDLETIIRTRITETTPADTLSTSPERIEKPVPEVFKDNLNLGKEAAPVRPSRLPQVGRIPKVISARPEATSPKSFSRPFARLSVSQPLQVPLILDKESVALGPSPPKPSTPEPVHTQSDIELKPKAEPRQNSGDSKTTDSTATSHHDFLAFSPRQNSQTTTNTSSSGGNMSFAGITAVIPEPDAALEEDEVWDEYDDLIENGDGAEVGVSRVPSSAASSLGRPFQYEGYESGRVRRSRVVAKESPIYHLTPAQIGFKTTESPPRHSFATGSSIYSTDLNLKQKDARGSINTPTTPMSFADFISGYGDRNNIGSSVKVGRRGRGSGSGERRSVDSSGSSGLLTQMAEKENRAPVSQVNLRVGSMTVSKWLTFGHVLFSPAREEIEAAGKDKHHSILVIDGLGNDDWSFYAAETYPNAIFYNLSPTQPLSPSAQRSPLLTPSNHHQVPFPSLATSTPFPFPANTFHLIVFRFPPALPFPAYQAVISESYRCLVPGGYVELALLDIDINHMGNRARRAVRGLKVKMHERDEAVFLGSVGDAVVRELGRGVGEGKWEGVKSCGVGVPVTSLKSNGSEQSSRSSTGSSGRGSRAGSRAGSRVTSKGPRSKAGEGQEQMSLAEMISSSSSQASNDSITKMVAKVGRWWYSRCYEQGVAAESGEDGERSIWQDPKVLAECETWNASFKLVVAFARKGVPMGLKRRGRGASV